MKQLSQQQVNHLMMLHQHGRYTEGVEEAQKLIKAFPGELMLFNLLGVCLEQEGAFQKAAMAMKKSDALIMLMSDGFIIKD